MTSIRMSPVHAQLEALQPQWEERLGMQVAAKLPGDAAAMLEAVAIADLSHLRKCGLKGPGAERWLRDHDIPVPDGVNAWAMLPAGGVIARLGRSEFFVEDGEAGVVVESIGASLGFGAAGVYPVIRQDAGFALAGRRVNELLVQTCNVNFEAFGAEEKIAVMTQMVGVSVLAIRAIHARVPCYRLWCDPTFAPYFRETLTGIAEELGGAAIGVDALPI
ncbi:MAG TPA: hypothetical protein VHB46_15185 [Burkholderiales bacterium]|nr:hypothetical protein [Burkholderiales bacterium]